ncbi:MAG: sensor/response regulator hybrid, partial [Phycisphaerales bacterium]|nr:sensor/response regulator hybrid [Phycisphaerales bacterium]
MNKAPDNSTSGNGDANRFLRVEPARSERGEAERGRPVKEPERERTQLAEVLEQSPSFMAILRGPRHVFELVNKRYCQLVGSRDLIGRPVR